MSRRWIGNDDRRNRKGILEVLPVLLAFRGFPNLIQLGKMEKKNGFFLFNLLFFIQIGVDNRFARGDGAQLVWSLVRPSGTAFGRDTKEVRKGLI